jgi:hypothetical protein
MKKNETLSFAGKWMKLGNIILSEVSQAQKAKNRMSASYEDFIPKTSAVIFIGHRSHAEGRTHTGGIAKGRKPKT